MKKGAAVILVFLCFLCLVVTSCAESASAQDFDAKVLEVFDHAVLVEPLAGEPERKSADQIMISTVEISADRLPPLEEGTVIRIAYSGSIAESYPAQIHEVFAVSLVENDAELKKAE